MTIKKHIERKQTSFNVKNLLNVRGKKPPTQTINQASLWSKLNYKSLKSQHKLCSIIKQITKIMLNNQTNNKTTEMK